MLQLRRPPPPATTLTMQPSSAPPSPEAPPLDASQRRIHRMLARYIIAIKEEDYRPRLNDALRASASSQGSADNMNSYYATRPGLRKYTLGVELDRDLDYTIILGDGEAVTDKQAIRSYFGVDESGEPLGEIDDGGAISREELLIRAANQSLLADALAALTGSEGVLEEGGEGMDANPGLVLSGPLLSMTSVVEKCHFTVDLQRERVEAICVLAVSVPIENRRLVLARAILIITFRPGKSRQMQYIIKMIKAHHSPLSKTLHDAATSLAQDQENLLSQSSSGEESDNFLTRSFNSLWSR